MSLVIVSRNWLGDMPVSFLNARLKADRLVKPDSNAMSMMWVSWLRNSIWACLMRSAVKNATKVVLV